MHPFTKAEYDVILAAFRQLLTTVLKNERPANYNSGICANAAEICRGSRTEFDHMWHGPFDISSRVAKQWSGWVEGESSPGYPIPENKNDWKWENNNRLLRINYLRYLIKRTRDFKRRAKE